MQPGTLQSGCRWLVGDVSAQKAESNGGHTPRGYPGQALPVGPGELSGMCLVTYELTVPTGVRSVWSKTLNRLDIHAVGRRAQLWANFGLRSWRWLASAPSRSAWRRVAQNKGNGQANYYQHTQ